MKLWTLFAASAVLSVTLPAIQGRSGATAISNTPSAPATTMGMGDSKLGETAPAAAATSPSQTGCAPAFAAIKRLGAEQNAPIGSYMQDRFVQGGAKCRRAMPLKYVEPAATSFPSAFANRIYFSIVAIERNANATVRRALAALTGPQSLSSIQNHSDRPSSRRSAI
ncbi:MAG TPA: hypothetical protein VGN30_17170 [Steroidobacteraceae bacterium]